MSEAKNLNVANARIMFKNFSGKGNQFNRQGDRNFCVRIDSREMAENLRKDGWNVKTLPPRDPEEDPLFYMQVKVSYNVVPPRVYMIAGKSKTLLTEESIDTLDFAEISNADLIISPYHWSVNGKSGVKAYLKTMYVTIEQDVFASKYADEEGPEEDVPF